MTSTILLAAALLAQAGAPAPAELPVGADRVDVAYEELAGGDARAAIDRIHANAAVPSDDPAALINLGTAYAMLGRTREAELHYRAAIASPDRYELQLADGNWMDSRRLARRAAEGLSRGEVLAAR